MVDQHDSPNCPDCGVLGSYDGVGREGNAWTGKTFAYRYCPECDRRWKSRTKHLESPSPRRVED